MTGSHPKRSLGGRLCCLFLLVLYAILAPLADASGRAAILDAGAITVRYAQPLLGLSPLAFGMVETGYLGPNVLATDPLERRRVKALGVRYIRLHLRYDVSGDPTSKIVCAGDGCETRPTGDDWIRAIKAIGAQPILVVNSSPPTDAANLVRHFNVNPTTNAPDSHLPTYVKYWIIGNEPNLGAYSPASYSDIFNQDYDVMKAIDSRIKIGGPAVAWYDRSWIAGFLQGSGSRVDFVDFHGYSQEGCDTCSPSSLPRLFKWAKDLGANVANLRELIRQLIPARASAIGIQVGEWSLNSGGSLQTYSNFASVWTADVLGNILKNGALSLFYGTKGNALKMITGDVVNDRGATVHMQLDDYQAAAHGYGMFTGEGLFRAFGRRLVSAVTTLRDVDVFASDSPKNIVVVNTNQTQDKFGTFSLDVSKGSVNVWQKSETVPFAAPPIHVASFRFTGGSFAFRLPALSVTTFVVRPAARR